MLLVAATLIVGACVVGAWWVPWRIRASTRTAKSVLSAALEGVEGERDRMVAANEALADIEHELAVHSERPKRLAWIAFLGGFAVAVASRFQGGATGWLVAVLSVAAGMSGALLCLLASFHTARATEKAQAVVDAHAETLVGDLYDVAIVLPKRREMRWKRTKRTR